MKITKKKIEEMVKKYLDREVWYIGKCHEDKTFALYSLKEEEFIFMPQQFFIDFINEECKPMSSAPTNQWKSKVQTLF